jgi:hypothetical protein
MEDKAMPKRMLKGRLYSARRKGRLGGDGYMTSRVI